MEARVDRTALRFNQASIITGSLLAFVLGQPVGPWLVLAVALVMAIGTVWPAAGLFKLVYARLLRPTGLLRPDVVEDEPRAHLFAQGVGATVLFAGFATLVAGWTVAGWFLVWVVIALALTNLLFGFCAGCFLYYQLGRLGLVRARAPR